VITATKIPVISEAMFLLASSKNFIGQDRAPLVCVPCLFPLTLKAGRVLSRGRATGPLPFSLQQGADVYQQAVEAAWPPACTSAQLIRVPVPPSAARPGPSSRDHVIDALPVLIPCPSSSRHDHVSGTMA
jgi:hypothetical protein